MKDVLNNIKSGILLVLILLLISTTFAAIFATMPIWVWFPRKITDAITKYMNWVIDLARGL